MPSLERMKSSSRNGRSSHLSIHALMLKAAEKSRHGQKRASGCNSQRKLPRHHPFVCNYTRIRGPACDHQPPRIKDLPFGDLVQDLPDESIRKKRKRKTKEAAAAATRLSAIFFFFSCA
ncbi:hypothetical protein TNCV_860251 [Trichonephila clavipes]|nr:hypothetical protein TNCV_860251 [Trichonephila clavipes]